MPHRVFEEIFAAAPDAIIVVGGDGVIQVANPAAERLFDSAEGGLLGLPIETLIPPSLRNRHRELRADYSRRPSTRPMGIGMQLQACTLKRREFPVEVSLSPARAGNPETICIVRDVTERMAARRTERELKRAQALSQVSLQCLQQRSMATTGREVIRVLRRALGADLAVRLQRVDASTLCCVEAEGIHVDRLEGRRMAIDDRQAAGRVVIGAIPLLVGDTRDAQTPVCDLLSDRGIHCVIAVPVTLDNDTEGVIIVASRAAHSMSSDDLAFVEAAANILASALMRARTEERLLQAQRLESLGQLTGGVAHDFNNLLTVIGGNLQILEEFLPTDEFARRALAAGQRATRRGAELTGKLLAFSRRQTLQPKAVDVDALLRGFVDLLNRTLGGNIEIIVRTESVPLVALVDGGQLETALLNLAVNARDAMPEGGTLELSAYISTPAKPSLSPDGGDVAAKAYVCIAVRDTGTGMTDDVASRAFEPFFTTKAPGKGSGLGLSMVYGFVRQSAGHVTLESRSGQGTTICIYLPRVETYAAQPEPPQSAATTVGDGPKVLLIEDDRDVAEVISHQLQSLRCKVWVAANRRQALARLQKVPDIAVIVADVLLERGETGPAVVRSLLARKSGLRVIYTSGYARDALPLELSGDGIHGFLRKPFTLRELADVLARATKGQA